MIFRMVNNGNLKISKKVLDSFSHFRQDYSYKREAGGILLGRYIENSNDIVIDKVTVPYQSDIRRRYYFHKKDLQHQHIINQEWEISDGTCNYLGEWHTHPENVPTPSAIDINGWKKKLQEDSFDHHSLYFIIVGIKEIKTWETCVIDNSITELKEI